MGRGAPLRRPGRSGIRDGRGKGPFHARAPAVTDADRLGLADGAPVLLRSSHGELHALVHRAPLRPGNVQVFYPEGNVLLPGGYRDRSGVPDYNTTVEVVPQ